ncbi:MAG: FAD-dependent oxidoreductase [Candidatus Wallbacteria bacterium]|nr:FAD-dependent oxidoreductase [Candidatus Wallbacteria bacterium]
MSGHFHPLPFEQLLDRILTEYRHRKSIFSIPEDVFFRPGDKRFHCRKFGQLLETPVGVAAGPHTQMAQNIVSAWLCGGRYIELKTVQVLDQLDVTKPCIDMEDEGYNCEWSQELRLTQSFDEYLKAWVLLHVLKKVLGHPETGAEPGFIFNMSVGYNLEGIKSPSVQAFLASMSNAGETLKKYLGTAGDMEPSVRGLEAGSKLSDNITLSTMHGCPPDEIAQIASYLIRELGCHTVIKFNPTLLGALKLREILNDRLGFGTIVPDEAFGHDPKYEDALSIIDTLRKASDGTGREFSVKLTNTLESVNNRTVFPQKEKMMYMSGRPLHVLDMQLAARLASDLKGAVAVSFSAGADAFNLGEVLACGIRPVTVCSDLLKPGGYGRMSQYLDELKAFMNRSGAVDLDGLVCASCLSKKGGVGRVAGNMPETVLENEVLGEILRDLPEKLKSDPLSSVLEGFFTELEPGILESSSRELVSACGMVNTADYAGKVLEETRYRKDYMDDIRLKSTRELSEFDCAHAPCTFECPVNQRVPEYMKAVAQGRVEEAMAAILDDNPLPGIAGRVCDHQCRTRCVRGRYDRPLFIREIKRFATDHGRVSPVSVQKTGLSVAVVGAGPSGLSCAYFLARSGCAVSVYERHARAGGMAQHAIPPFRLDQSKINEDIARLSDLGVSFQFGSEVDDAFLATLVSENDAVYVAAGAVAGRRLDIPGEDAPWVMDALDFLDSVRKGETPLLGKTVAVIGGGNSAVDVARTAFRTSGCEKVLLVYRRSRKEMPADREEIAALLKEGVVLMELTAPVFVDGNTHELECVKMELGNPGADGRRKPVPVKGSEFRIRPDTLIVAVGQQSELGFLKGSGVQVKNDGRIVADEKTGATGNSKIFAGGDAVRGAATLIKAMGDGKRAAMSILKRELSSRPVQVTHTLNEHLSIRSRRVFPQALNERPVSERRDMEEYELTLTEDAAAVEAERCLSCDEFCGLCVTVCPNRAYFVAEIEPFGVDWPGCGKLGISQRFQVLNIVDFCNECGNCATFCPTSGEPYKIKPRLCLSAESFNHEDGDRYFCSGQGSNAFVEAEFQGQRHLLKASGQGFLFSGSGVECTVHEDLSLSELKSGDNADTNVALRNLFRMLIVWRAVMSKR